MRLTWWGHSTVLVEVDGVRVLADPVLRHRPGALRRASPLPAPAPDADVVLVSHLHHDHCDLPTLRRLRARTVVVPRGAGRWLADRGVPGVTELAHGEVLRLAGGVTVTAVPADHHGRREPWGPSAPAGGHVVEGAPAAVWLAGDTALFPAMSDLASATRRGRLDVAAVPVWGWGPRLGPGHMDPEQAAEAVVRAGAAQAVPVHWGTLHPAGLGRAMRRHLTTPGRRFADAVTARARAEGLDTTACVLEVGESLVVSCDVS